MSAIAQAPSFMAQAAAVLLLVAGCL
eukprot:COSAG06_NODE_42368_length_382_cov_0.901060_1_plen_25_part_01